MTKKVSVIVIIMTLTSIILHLPSPGYAHDDRADRVPEGVYLKLTKDYYEHLRKSGQSGVRTYNNDPAEGYLKEIAVSTRFVVETNLQILKQQERIIQLLQDILDKQK